MSNKAKAFIVCLFFVIIVIGAALLVGLFLAAVYESIKSGPSEIKTQMVVAAKNPCGNFEPAMQAQYLSDGTICIIGITYNAVWIDRFGGRHEVPTEYVVVK